MIETPVVQYDFDAIPQSLKALPQWVAWRYAKRDGKITKVPYNVRTGGKAQSNNPQTWATWAEAEAVAARYSGLGFVVTEAAGIVGGDLDHCIDGGVVAEWADEIVQGIDTYTEITPSGTGLRFLAIACLPPGGRKKGDIECYQSGRFLTITGARFGGAPEDLMPRQEQVAAFHAKYFTNGASANGTATNGHENEAPQPVAVILASLPDDTLWSRIRQSKNADIIERLYRGEWDWKYRSQSEADSALCFHLAFWTRKDAGQMDALFRGSGLMREKWDQVHHSSGETYGQKTIAQAIAKCRSVYEPVKRLPDLVSGRHVRNWIKGGDDEEADDQEADEAGGLTDATGEPVNKKATYKVQYGRTLNHVEKINATTNQVVESAMRVCDFAAHITEEITSEDGTTIFRIQGRSRENRTFDLELDAAQFSDTKPLVAALANVIGANCVLYAGMEKHIGPAIKSFSGRFAFARRFNRVGWAGDEFIIPGREAPDTTIQLNRKLPYGINPTADLATGLRLLDALVLAQRPESTTVCLAAMFQAPLARLAHWRDERYALFITGRTGSFKSSWAIMAMCLYGKDFQSEDRLVKFGQGATNNSIMDNMVCASDVPFLVDNYKPSTGGGAKDLVNLIHSSLEGGEKDRLNRNSKQRVSRPVHTWPVFTGEDVPDSDAASMARVLVVPFAWNAGAENPHLTTVQHGADHLSAVGGAWIDWLRSDDGVAIATNIADRFNNRRSWWSAQLRKQRSDMVNINRVASNLASNQLTWEIMRVCPMLADIAARHSAAYERGIHEVAAGMAAHTAESLEANRFLAAVSELLASGSCVLTSRSMHIRDEDKDRHIGYRDDNGIYLLPKKTREKVDRLLISTGGMGMVSDMALHKQLESIGKVAQRGKGEVTRAVRMAEGVARVLHLKPNSLGDEDEDL